MCLSEGVSWTTLFLGTITNIICIIYLLNLNNKKQLYL